MSDIRPISNHKCAVMEWNMTMLRLIHDGTISKGSFIVPWTGAYLIHTCTTLENTVRAGVSGASSIRHRD